MTTRRFFKNIKRRFSGRARAIRMVRAGMMECRARAAAVESAPESEGVMMNGCMFPVERRK